jgi:hypothetical protein
MAEGRNSVLDTIVNLRGEFLEWLSDLLKKDCTIA